MTTLLFSASGTFNAVAPQCVTNAEFSEAFAKAMHRPALLGTPSFVIKCLYDSDRAYLMHNCQKVKPKRTLVSGFEFKFADIKNACDALVRWWIRIRFLFDILYYSVAYWITSSISLLCAGFVRSMFSIAILFAMSLEKLSITQKKRVLLGPILVFILHDATENFFLLWRFNSALSYYK